MKYKCIDNVGYESRLTIDKVYECSLTNGAMGEPHCLLVILCDDGEQGELFPERFERVKHPLAEGLSKLPVMPRVETAKYPFNERYASEDNRVFPQS